MAHSKNDVPFFGGTLRQRTNTKKGIPTVECALIDPNTTCPYTNAELYRALLRRSEERPALASAVEHEIREIAEKANDNPNAEFRVQCSGKTKADAEKRAKKELHPRLALIAKLLYRPLWESSVAGGRPTVADFVEYMGDDLFRAVTPGDRPNLMSALRTAILPIIKDKRLDELVSEEQVKKEKDKINRLLTKTHAKDTKRRNVKRAYTILFRTIVESGFAGCKNALELADSIEMTKQQNRKLSNSILPGNLDAHQRCSLFTRTEYPKTDPSYRLIPISQELGERLIAERENLELRYGDMSLLLRIGQPEESEYYTDAVTISSHMRQLKEQIPQLLRQPEFLEEMRKNRPYTFDKASQDEYLNNMLTSHALRRYFCTWLYTVSGVETNEIYSLMGHLNKNIRQRSGPCGPTPAEIYRLCLLKHVSRTLFHAAHPLQYNLGEKCRETEVPACSVEFTIPPETSWEIVVEDSEPFNHVALRGNGITWDVRYQDEFRPNPNRYALLATEEMYTIQSKGKFLDALKKATKGEKLNK